MYGYIAILRAHHIPPDLECPGLEPENCIFWRFISNFDVSVILNWDKETICKDTMHPHIYIQTSLVAQKAKRLSTMQETWVRSLGWEDSLEKEMATHSSTLALKILWTEELGAGYCPWGRKESGTTEQLHYVLIMQNSPY